MWCLAARGLAKDRTHPGPPTPCRVASECMDTAEVERMTSLELVARPAMTHGVAVLCLLSYIRNLQDGPSASTEVVSRQLVKEHPPLPVAATHRSPGLRRCAGRLKRQRKRPGTLRIPGLCEQSLKGARSGAPCSRTPPTLAPIKAMPRRTGLAHRLRRQRRDERDQTLQGSVGSNDVARFHDEVLCFWLRLRRAGFSMEADCK